MKNGCQECKDYPAVFFRKHQYLKKKNKQTNKQKQQQILEEKQDQTECTFTSENPQTWKLLGAFPDRSRIFGRWSRQEY